MSPLPAAPLKEVSMDFAELLGNEYLLIITADYSRFPIVEIVKSTSPNTVPPRLDKVFSEFGIPDVVRSHNSPLFNSNEFQMFLQDLGFRHQKVILRWPRAISKVERLQVFSARTARKS